MSRTDCRCEKCKACCLRKPGWFAPGEATKAAAYLGLSLQEFFERYLTVDFWADAEKGDTDVLSPAWDTSAYWGFRKLRLPNEREDHRGHRASWGDGLLTGPCRLLTPTGCRLPFEYRPHECRVVYDCDADEAKRLVRPGLVPLWRADSSELVQLKIGGE